MVAHILSALLMGASLFTVPIDATSIYTGVSFTSFYYDCCKPGCAWPKQGDFLTPLRTCSANNQPIFDDGTTASYCGEGPASSCLEQTSWAVNDTFSYGFASIFITGADSPDWCCSCYEIEFLDSVIKGKKMIVQGINNNINENQINWISLAVPGQADWRSRCEQRFGGSYDGFFGKDAKGYENVTQCDQLPEQLHNACRWRYDWYQNVEGPNATFTRVQCPAELTDVSGCVRRDDATFNSSASAASPRLDIKSPSPTLVVSLTVAVLFFGFQQFLEYF